ncbi:MAG: hypothetical protein KAJ62_13635 [Desulfobacteraceae bacterium]|nr:hypothetical protein [Desulfobacteraceae bacterium]
MKYNMVYTKKIKNSFSNIGQSGELKIANIMNMLQDIAVEYAMKLKISSRDLASKNLFWVISRYQIEIHNFAELNQDLLISVWRSAHKRLYDLRWFKIETENNTAIVNAVGAWVIINKKTGAPRHLDDFMTEEMLCENKVDVTKFFHNLKMIDNTNHENTFKIRMHDLDLNRHVNNATYVEWAIEALPENILKGFTIKKINVIYLKESFYPGKIISKTQIINSFDNLVTYHSIIGKNTGLELARLNISWKSL